MARGFSYVSILWVPTKIKWRLAPTMKSEVGSDDKVGG